MVKVNLRMSALSSVRDDKKKISFLIYLFFSSVRKVNKRQINCNKTWQLTVNCGMMSWCLNGAQDPHHQWSLINSSWKDLTRPQKRLQWTKCFLLTALDIHTTTIYIFICLSVHQRARYFSSHIFIPVIFFIFHQWLPLVSQRITLNC